MMATRISNVPASCHVNIEVFPLLKLPSHLLWKIFDLLSREEKGRLRLVDRCLRQLVDDHLWGKLFLQRLPPCIIQDTPQRYLENGHAQETYQFCSRIIPNLARDQYQFSTLTLRENGSTLTSFAVGYRRVYAGQSTGRVVLWEKRATFQAVSILEDCFSPVYDLGSSSDYLTVASGEELDIWQRDQNHQFHWLQTLHVGHLEKLLFSEDVLFTQAISEKVLFLWKRIFPGGSFQVVQKIDRVKDVVFMDDFFAIQIQGIGLQIRSGLRHFLTIHDLNPAFWLAGPYFCVRTEEGVEIWEKKGLKMVCHGPLPLPPGIAEIQIWQNHLCILYKQQFENKPSYDLWLLDISQDFNLARTLKNYHNFYLRDKILFAETLNRGKIEVWQKKGPFIHRIQSFLKDVDLTDLVLFHNTLFLVFKQKVIFTCKRKDDNPEFHEKKILRKGGPLIEEIQFKGGFLVALTVEQTAEIWDYTI